MATESKGMATNEDLYNLNNSYVLEYSSEKGQLSSYCPTYLDLSASTTIKTDLTPVSGSMTSSTPLAGSYGSVYTASGNWQDLYGTCNIFGPWTGTNQYDYIYVSGISKYRQFTIPAKSKLTIECELYCTSALYNSSYWLVDYNIGNAYPAYLILGKTTTATPNSNYYAYAALQLKLALNESSGNTKTTASFTYENTGSTSQTGYVLIAVNKSKAQASNIRTDMDELDKITSGQITTKWTAWTKVSGTVFTGGTPPPSTLVLYSNCRSLTYYPQMTVCINPLSGAYADIGAVGTYNVQNITWKAEYYWDGSVKLTKSGTTPGNTTGTCFASAKSYTLITISGTSTPYIRMSAILPAAYLNVSASAVSASYTLFYTATTANGGTVTGSSSSWTRTITKVTNSYYNFYSPSGTVMAYIYPNFKSRDDMINLTVQLYGSVNISGGSGGCSARSIGEWDA